MKQFYIIYVGDYDGQSIAETVSPQELTNEQFKEEAERQGHVYTPEELCAEWNTDSLPVIDSYVRYL